MFQQEINKPLKLLNPSFDELHLFRFCDGVGLRECPTDEGLEFDLDEGFEGFGGEGVGDVAQVVGRD